MKCPKCQTQNPEDNKFCRECGEKLPIICPQCSVELLPEDKFCGKCGYDLRAPKEAPPIDFSQPQSYTPKFLADKILTTRSSIEGERKLVTVLFADVADYTAISEKLDPEEVHQIMDGCFKILMDEIHKYEGTINQFTGDGVMALFGAPVAHEDHAQRACYASLSIQKAVKEYGERIRKDIGMDFTMRIGLNSGPVIVGSIGDDLRMDYTAVGDTTNLAARIQQIANPGQVWLSQKTHNIVQDYFHDELVEQTHIKGKSQPQSIYHIMSERPGVRTRFQAGMVRGITGLVGRRPEIETLKAALQRAKGGDGQVVDVVGEAGVGKSRLIYEFQRMFEEELIFLTGNCVQYGRNISYLPVIDILKEALRIEEGMTEDQIGHRIEEEAAHDLAQMIPFYRNLLSLKVDDPRFKAIEPEGRKFGTFEAVKDLLIYLSKQKPLVVFLDDVHWIDKISEALFTYLARCIFDRPILMLSAYRPEGAPTWAQGAHYQRLGLETLSSKSSVKLVRNMLNVPALEPALEERIVEKTDGNPFFVEEIVRELLDRGDIVKSGEEYICARPIEQCEIPNTVQGVLAARMDRLSEDLKRTMQVASVIGRDFAFRLLKSIMEIGDELRTQMTNLVGLEILYEKALYPELEYIFKHALTQEVAYDSLLKQRRREIHGHVAQIIEELYADRLENHYESLAHHYERSGNSAKAVEYLLLAGEKSNQYGSSQAAREFLDKALEISKKESLSIGVEKEVRLFFERATADMGIGAIGDAVKGFKKAIDLSRCHDMEYYEKVSLLNLANLMRIWPIQEEAEQTFEEMITRAKSLEDRYLELAILLHKVFASENYGFRSEIYHLSLRAEEAALELKNPRIISLSRFVRAIFERFLGQPRKCVELTEGMVESMLSMSNISVFAIMCTHRGMALAEMGRIEDAMVILRHTIDQFEKFGVSYYLGPLNNCLGYCYGEIYQTGLARKFNLESEEIERRLLKIHPIGRREWAHELGHTLTSLVENHLDEGNVDDAWEGIKAIQQEAKSEAFFFNRYQWESRMNYLAAQVLLQRNEIDQAETIIQENLEKVRKDLMRKREGSFLRVLGEVQMRRNEHENAIKTLNEAIHIFKEVENPRQLWQAHASLGSVFDGLKRFDESSEQWGAAAEIIQNTANGLSDQELREGFLNAKPIREILSKASS
jgi:class 3 adenylate cyclase/tetratricopeptide (TPR) repeat protein